MEQVIRRRVVVQAGGHIELKDAALQGVAEADVIVIVNHPDDSSGKQAAIDLLDTLPGSRLFKTSSEADEYLRGERDSWDR